MGKEVLQEGITFSGPNGLLLTLSEINCPDETQALAKQGTLLEGMLRWRARGKGTQENCSSMWLVVSSFMEVGLVSGLSLH